MKKLMLFVFTAFAAFLFSSCSDKVPASTVNSAADVNGKIIGVIENTAAAYYADGYGTLRLYSTGEAMIADLRAGVLDCAIADDAAAQQLISNSRKVKALDEPFLSADFSIVTAKQSRDLLAQINTAIAELRLDGTLLAAEQHYLTGTQFSYTRRTDIPANAGTLRLAVSGGLPPYGAMQENGEITGLDVDIAQMICDRLGVNLEITESPLSGIAKTVWSSRADFGMGGMYENSATEELVDFSDSYSSCILRIITRK